MPQAKGASFACEHENFFFLYHVYWHIYRGIERKSGAEKLRCHFPLSQIHLHTVWSRLVLAAFSSWSLVFDLWALYIFTGMVLVGFLFVMQGERVDQLHNRVYCQIHFFKYACTIAAHRFILSFSSAMAESNKKTINPVRLFSSV